VSSRQLHLLGEVTLGYVHWVNTEALQRRIAALRPDQQDRLDVIMQALEAITDLDLLPNSDIVSRDWAVQFADVLQLHHSVSAEPFTKDKFEYAVVEMARILRIDATKAPKGNPGWDITFNGQRVSLKTQADKNIKPGRLHISKFMELGRGSWAVESDLVGLRQRMFDHMSRYDRIISLRALAIGQEWFGEFRYQYELVEIPKELLSRSANFIPTMIVDSTQSPKPGICKVLDDRSELIFELYFDGGTERKLQIRNLRKSDCIVHATWTFTRPTGPLV
jgi:hypothetical protein